MSISIILVAPQMGENIGAAARAMKNFGLYDLRVVNPRDGWPNDKAMSVAAGAADVIANAKIFDNIAEAVNDLHYIYAATAKPRDLNKECIFAENLSKDLSQDIKVGIMFGRENNGLNNQEVAYANKILTINTSAEYTSLNLAQSVAIICHQIFSSGIIKPGTNNIMKDLNKDLATYGEYEYFYAHMFRLLDKQQFFREPDKKERMILKIKNIFARIDNLTQSEIQTLRGIIAVLSEKN